MKKLELNIDNFIKIDYNVVKQEHVYIFKELAKDISLFIAGIFIGPVVDASQLINKHYHIWKDKKVK